MPAPPRPYVARVQAVTDQPVGFYKDREGIVHLKGDTADGSVHLQKGSPPNGNIVSLSGISFRAGS